MSSQSPTGPTQSVPHPSGYWQDQRVTMLDTTGPPPKKRKALPWIVGAVLLLFAGGVAAFALLDGKELTRETAQRECRTALEREAHRRADNLGGVGDGGVLISITGVDMQETWETGTGYAVNGTVKYTLTTSLLPQVAHSVSLTCEATAAENGVTTTVKNRT